MRGCVEEGERSEKSTGGRTRSGIVESRLAYSPRRRGRSRLCCYHTLTPPPARSPCQHGAVPASYGGLMQGRRQHTASHCSETSAGSAGRGSVLEAGRMQRLASPDIQPKAPLRPVALWQERTLTTPLSLSPQCSISPPCSLLLTSPTAKFTANSFHSCFFCLSTKLPPQAQTAPSDMPRTGPSLLAGCTGASAMETQTRPMSWVRECSGRKIAAAALAAPPRQGCGRWTRLHALLETWARGSRVDG